MSSALPPKADSALALADRGGADAEAGEGGVVEREHASQCLALSRRDRTMRCCCGLTILAARLERALNAGAELAVHPRLLHTSRAFDLPTARQARVGWGEMGVIKRRAECAERKLTMSISPICMVAFADRVVTRITVWSDWADSLRGGGAQNP